MIRSLRRWHLRWVVLLAIALPLLLFLALRHRQEVPRVDTLPTATDGEPAAEGAAS